MSKPSTNPPSGFRDFLPAEAAARTELVEVISTIYRGHGFQNIGMPLVENLSTLQGKGGGGENEKLMFKVMKRGEDLQRSLAAGDELADMGLRFDLTLPLARYCARFREQLPKPFKVFQIGPVWRADRPQKGRYRELYQCDVDIIGSKEIGAEIDCISAILEVFAAVGIDGVEVHLNDRRLLSALGAKLGLSAGTWAKCLIVLDKLDKIGPEKVREEILATVAAGDPGVSVPTESIDRYLLAGDDSTVNSWSEVDSESFSTLVALAEQLCDTGGAKIVINPTLVRGQDYYTGTIFEFRHPSLSGSLGGGGRYNRLMEVFGTPETPACGGSIGFERLLLILEESGRLGDLSTPPDLFFPLFEASLRPQIQELATGLRLRGIAVDVFPDAAKLKNQFKYADDRKIPFTAIYGGDEAHAKVVKLKDMAKGTESSYSIEPPEAFFDAMVELCKQ